MLHKSKQRRQKAWDDGVAPSGYLLLRQRCGIYKEHGVMWLVTIPEDLNSWMWLQSEISACGVPHTPLIVVLSQKGHPVLGSYPGTLLGVSVPHHSAPAMCCECHRRFYPETLLEITVNYIAGIWIDLLRPWMTLGSLWHRLGTL